MDIKLLQLPHQKDALDAIIKALDGGGGVDERKKTSDCANPLLKMAFNEEQFIDVKMETGTGKTYVYTRAMFELHKRYGLFKFIIVVPNCAIREGTKNFIESDYCRKHFLSLYPNTQIQLCTIDKSASFAKKKGRRLVPAAFSEFCNSQKYSRNTIQCLLLCDKGFLNREAKDGDEDKRKTALFRSDYDQTFFDSMNTPIDALKDTLPVLFIDEPHDLKRQGISYKNIVDKEIDETKKHKTITPQLIIRFGATFPIIEKSSIVSAGGSKTKTVKTQEVDYYRGGGPLYELSSIEAFKQGLVKKVNISFPFDGGGAEKNLLRYKVKSVNNKVLVLTHNGKDYEVRNGQALNEVIPEYSGDEGFFGGGKLSDGTELEKGEEFLGGRGVDSYQVAMIGVALDKYFETEAKNFLRKENKLGNKIKTIALFFINDIDAYRSENGKLKKMFEKLLRGRLEALLKVYTTGEYHDYLKYTLDNIKSAHGGYFAQDWGEKDDGAVKEELADILHKERTLSFKKENGVWNIRRFFFSKWTLKEGWDNPNVFVICKLRTSGSETSKIQEVGRGLRLPVDENGNRVTSENWWLDYVVNFDEEDFAKKLLGEINSSSKVFVDETELTNQMIKIISEKRGISEDDLLNALDEKGVITRSNKFKPGGFEKFLQEYPELRQYLVGQETVRVNGEEEPIKLRKENWQKVRDFWKVISKRYLICLDGNSASDEKIEKIFCKTLDSVTFDDNKKISVETFGVEVTKSSEVRLTDTRSTISNDDFLGQMTYNEWVKKLANATNIPLKIIHKCFWQKLQSFLSEGKSKAEVNRLINYKNLEAVKSEWKKELLASSDFGYEYSKLDFYANLYIMKKDSDEFVDTIARGLVGAIKASDIEEDERNLYELPLSYDSEDPEHKILKQKVQSAKVITFGKLPRKAIKVPLITGGTSTPDFLYALDEGENKKLYILLEAKSTDKRGSESLATKAQKKLFDAVKSDASGGGAFDIEWKEVTSAKEVEAILSEMGE